jgi:hypothetical protein
MHWDPRVCSLACEHESVSGSLLQQRLLKECLGQRADMRRGSDVSRLGIRRGGCGRQFRDHHGRDRGR